GLRASSRPGYARRRAFFSCNRAGRRGAWLYEPNETKRNEAKRSETKRNEAKRSETKRNERKGPKHANALTSHLPPRNARRRRLRRHDGQAVRGRDLAARSQRRHAARGGRQAGKPPPVRERRRASARDLFERLSRARLDGARARANLRRAGRGRSQA